jgi:hypothetical protein
VFSPEFGPLDKQHPNSLKLQCLDVPDVPGFIDFSSVQELVLEQCAGIKPFLRSLLQQQPRISLKKLVVMDIPCKEGETPVDADTINTVLKAVTGIELLVIHLTQKEGTSLPDISSLTCHSETLQGLSLHACTWGASFEEQSYKLDQIEELFRKCRKLRTLSIALPPNTSVPELKACFFY